MAKIGAGITNKQAKYLAALCREMKVPYEGRGMTREEASLAITGLQAQVEKKRDGFRKRYGG